jgi:LacI family transcriptional regulator
MALNSALIPSVTLLIPDDWADMHAAQAYSSGLLKPLEASFEAAGMQLDLFRLNASNHTSDTQAFEGYLAEKLPAAIIVARVLEQDPLIDLLCSEQIPFVLYGQNEQASSLEWVDIDNTAAFWLATRKCIDLGHRQIALLNGPDAFAYARRRELGYRRALRQSKTEFDEQLVVSGHPTFAMGSVMATYLLRQANRPTAMICTTDEMALGAMYACRDLGLEIGTDISIVG